MFLMNTNNSLCCDIEMITLSLKHWAWVQKPAGQFPHGGILGFGAVNKNACLCYNIYL